MSVSISIVRPKLVDNIIRDVIIDFNIAIPTKQDHMTV